MPESHAARDAPEDPLAALRGEIDALDDALHDLVMRRAAVVARLAASRVKGTAVSPLRPGREAAILRRLLARHSGPLPPAVLVRLWREILGSSSALQGGFAVAVPAGNAALAEAARTHFGPLAALGREPDAAAALAAVAAGRAQAAVLPVPAAAGGGAWWAALEDPRPRVVARLPFFAAGPAPEALLVSSDGPDPSGDDRSLLRLRFAVGGAGAGLRAGTSDAGPPPAAIPADAVLPAGRRPVADPPAVAPGGAADRSNAPAHAALLEALGAAGLPVHVLLERRGPNGARQVLAEIDGAVAPGDLRLPALRSILPALAETRPLGSYATPVRPTAAGGE
jgi:chorismate mutase/prephenate dehydratase